MSFDPPMSRPVPLTRTLSAHEIPITDREPFSKWRTYLITLAFIAFLLPIHLAQLFFYPMSFVAGGIRELYWAGITSTKETFARCLIYISGQTTLIITADDSIDLDEIVKKDKDSGKLMIKLAQQAGQSNRLRTHSGEQPGPPSDYTTPVSHGAHTLQSTCQITRCMQIVSSAKRKLGSGST